LFYLCFVWVWNLFFHFDGEASLRGYHGNTWEFLPLCPLRARSVGSTDWISLHPYLDTSWLRTTSGHDAAEEASVLGGYSNSVTFPISAALSAYPLWHYCCGYPHPRTAVILSAKLKIVKLRSTGTSNLVYSLPSSGSGSNYFQLHITTANRQTHCFD
jgi:hypothetical protein